MDPMAMTGAGASAVGAISVASHRGVDLGPCRGNSGFMRPVIPGPVIPRVQRPSAWNAPAFDLATARDAVR